MDVSIIIVNYNTLETTSSCIDSIFEKTSGIQFEVILIDNASTDGSREHFSNDKRITYHYSDINLGFGKANNKGLEIAQGRNILFLNPDTLLINNAIQILSDHLDRNRETGACGGNLFDYTGTPAFSFERIFPSLTSEFDRCLKGLITKAIYRRNRKFNYSEQDIGVAYIIGADLMIKKTILEEVGGFDERFFMYYEEVELCHRIHQKKYRITNVPSARITHLEGMSSRTTDTVTSLTRNECMRLEGRKTYYDITHGRLYHKTANLARYLYFYSRLAVVKNEDARKVLTASYKRFKELYK